VYQNEDGEDVQWQRSFLRSEVLCGALPNKRMQLADVSLLRNVR
jgi:hypothetical protein